MTPPRSFRTRLRLGFLLAAVGLMAATHLVTQLLAGREYHLVLNLGDGILPALVAGALVLAGYSQVRSGLSPFDELRGRLAALREGRERRLEGRYPSEVQPLVDDLNAFVAHREEAVVRAQATAGDLAHGLKTPLAVLSQEAERLAASGQPQLAAAVSEQVERMRRQIDGHLARARAAGPGAIRGPGCAVLGSVEGLARTLARLHADKGLAIEVAVPAHHAVRAQREDLDEMLGNLLDNACAWARRSVTVSSSAPEAGRLVLTVDDDGPGIPPERREAVVRRQVGPDEGGAAFGRGLAIVLDLVELYGGSLSLSDSPAGGLRAQLQLPAG